MTGHNAAPTGPIASATGDRWGWDCAQCGAWSRGYRCKSNAAAQRSADRHNREATETDRRVYQMLYRRNRL